MLMTPLAALRTALEVRLDGDARHWLHRALAQAGDSAQPAGPSDDQPRPWERYFTEAGERCGRPAASGSAPREPAPADPAPLVSSRSSGRPDGPSDLAEAARVLLLHAAGADTVALRRLHTHGTADERRAVLRALPHLRTGPDALPLVEDALDSGDPGLVAAAVGPYAEEHLEQEGWRRAVLTCLFAGVPLAAVSGLERRATGDAELVRMLNAFAAERAAAGRRVPGDLRRVLELACRPPRRAGVGPERA